MYCSEELRRYEPAIATAVEAAVDAAKDDIGFLRLDPAGFGSAPQKSIDYAVMEKTDLMAVVEGRFRWSDIGSWDAIFDIAPHDAAGNAIHGAGVAMDTHNCVIHSDDRLVAVLGAQDLVVVSTADAVLVLPRDRAQDVRELVAKLKALAAARGDGASPRPPAVGLLQLDRPRRALPGQAHRGASGGTIVTAEA